MSQEGARPRARLWLAQAQACFLAQQVGEKAIKALLAADDRDLRSHSLSALLRVLDKLDAPTRDPDALGDDLPAAVFGPEGATAALEASDGV